MANICSNIIEIEGTEDQIKAITDRIIEDDIKLRGDYYFLDPSNYYGREEIVTYKDLISISATSKWSPPEEELLKFSKEYPGVTITVVYEEPGFECYGKLVYEGGNLIEDKAYTPLEYYESEDADFKDELETLKEMDYKEFLKEYTKDNYFEDYPFIYLEREVALRIKERDLPLFINKKWEDSRAEEVYKKRLKGEKVTK